jgi:hypothetical protein
MKNRIVEASIIAIGIIFLGCLFEAESKSSHKKTAL